MQPSKYARFLDMSQELGKTREVNSFLQQALQFIMEDIKAEWGWVVLLGENQRVTQVISNRPDQTDHLLDDPVRASIVDRVIRQGQGRLMKEGTEAFPSHQAHSEKIEGERLNLCAPLQMNVQVLGAIYLERAAGDERFSEADLQTLEFSARLLATSIGYVRLQTTLEERIEQRTGELQSALKDMEQINQRLVNTNYQLRREIVVRQDLEYELVKLSRVVEQSPSSVMITDLEGKIEYVNPRFCDLTGYLEEEVLGKTPSILKSDLTPESTYKQLWQTLATGGVWRGEFINRKKNGELYWEYTVIAPAIDREGRISHYVAIKEDISDRKALEKLREDLTNSLVHDLRNPLTAINSSLHMFKTTPEVTRKLPEEYLDILETAYASGQRMMTMINAILDVTHLESHRLALDIQQVAVHGLLEEVIHTQTPIARLYEVKIINVLCPDLQDVAADPDLLKRVFQNLIDNALKFSPQNGEILIYCENLADTDFVKLAVRDHGSGIPPQFQSHLFQKFSVGANNVSGSGLGLAFCRLAVEAHGGRIWAENHPEGGAVFSFTLPVYRAK